MFTGGLGLCLVAASLALPWVQAWLPVMELQPISGLSVLLSAGSDDPWRLLAVCPVITAVTIAAWFIPSGRIRRTVEKTMLVLLGLATLGVLLVGAWNWLDVWPEGLAQTMVRWLSPGTWWISGGVIVWGFGQAACMVALHQRRGAARIAALHHRWAARPGASMVGAPLPSARLDLLPSRVRDLVVDAQRLRADLDAPIEPLSGSQLDLLLELVGDLCCMATDERTAFDRAGLDPDAIVRDLTPRSRTDENTWFDELRRLDATLHQLVTSVLRPPRPGYR
jgi:hypothetical protein